MHTTLLSIYHYCMCVRGLRLAYHTLTPRQTQVFNPPMHTRTHTLTRLLEKDVRTGEGMLLCIRPSLAMGIHRGTLAYMRWGIRLECARGEAKLRTCIYMHTYIEPCACVW